jgi:U3 small nucleolar RNA-associated protein 10
LFCGCADEAADVDLETVREAALSGIATLCKLDDRFAAYEDTLLSKDAMATPREMHTQDINQKIDKSITSLLRLLSPYLMNRPSHLVLEYLVRHYKVYHYNVDAVVECILPWHDSNVFARMVQLLNLSQSNGRWEFLTAVAKTGVPLPRHALAQRAARDMALLDFICSLAKRNGANTKGTQFTHVFSFFSAVVVEAMQGLTTLHEGLVRVVLPVLLIGVRATKSPHYQAACYFITAHLSSRTALSIEACNALLIALAKGDCASGIEHSLACTLSLVQKQPCITVYPNEAFMCLVQRSELAAVLCDMSSAFDISELLKLLLQAHLDHLTAATTAAVVDSSGSSDSGSSNAVVLASLMSIIHQTMPQWPTTALPALITWFTEAMLLKYIALVDSTTADTTATTGECYTVYYHIYVYYHCCVFV